VKAPVSPRLEILILGLGFEFVPQVGLIPRTELTANTKQQITNGPNTSALAEAG